MEKQNYFKGIKELYSPVITKCWQIKKQICGKESANAGGWKKD